MRDTQETEKEVGIIWWLLLGLCFLVVPVFLFLWYVKRTSGRVALASTQVLTYQIATTNFNSSIGRWPNSLRELQTNGMGVVFISTPHHNDPWSRPYIFVPYHSATGFGRILSFGRDGKPGGTGVDADIERRFP